jgi:Protein kinase domain/WD domain, G-beta repeat
MVDDSSRHAEGLLRMLAPGSRVSGYLLESQIGAGGMAVVFRARDERLSRMVALKVLAPGLAADDAFRQRFIRESRAAAAVDDPHIIPVYEAGEAGGVLFIAMRLVVGGDLRTVMLREGPLAPERAAALLSPVASALDAAHAADLVHRDVKPANVLVDARPGRPEHVYLSDFGLSKRAAAAVGLTGSGQFMGTAEYAAPEQINGRPVTGQADQYALACVAFETLTGAAPFARPEPMAVLWAQLSEPPPSLVVLRPDLPRGVDRILARALAKEPHHRYGTCREFIDELRVAFGLAPYEAAASSGSRAQMESTGRDAGATKTPTAPAAAPAGAAGRAASTDPRRGRHSSGESAQPGHSRRRRVGMAALAVVVLAAVGAIAAATHGGFGGHPSAGGLAGGTSGQAGGLAIRVSHIATLPDPNSAGVDAAAFSPGGAVLVTADRNGAVYQWNTDSDRRTAVIRDPGSNGVAAAAFSSSGKVLATGDQNGSAYMWTLATRHLIAALTRPGFSGVETAEYSPHGKTLAIGNEDGSTYLWDPQGNVTATLSDPNSDGVQALAFSPNGQTIATADLDGTTYLWSLATDSHVAALTVPGTSSQAVDGVAFSPNGKILATADQDGSAYLWNVAGRRRIATLTPPGPGGSSVYGVAFSPNGKILATADGNGSAYLWDVATGRRIVTLNNPGANSSVSSVAFSPNGKILATADQDGATILWRITSVASRP